ncbi:thioredoxin family protein [Streptosporangium subroseum]|uniref:thioredoxin family protein n=1 Tax=Streptosporangium subroseum TaxID=106412 RepID=UPI0030925614|nr:thioredoxin family protein [Streptosporangium subroseum]
MDLYFWSPTCGPCKNIAPLIDDAIEKGAHIRKLDVSSDTGRYVAKLFGVTATPTLVKFGKTDVVISGGRIAKEFQ